MKNNEQKTFEELKNVSKELDSIKDKNLKLQHNVNFNLFEKQRFLVCN
jgi:hypothetical protein